MMHTSWLKVRSPWAAFLHDCLAIPIAWFGAYWVRFNLDPIPTEYFHYAWTHLPIVMGLQAISFWVFGLYRGVWRFASLNDLNRIIKSITLGGLTIVLTLFFFTRLEHVPRSVLPVYCMTLVFILGGSRFIYRWTKDRQIIPSLSQKRVLIVGAGKAGDGVARDLLRHDKAFVPVGFIDDRIRKHGLEIHGVRILGATKHIPKLVKQHRIDMIIIALPSANAAQMRRINSYCEKSKVCVRTLPGMNDIVSGRVSIQSLRHVSIEDLLGRDPVSLDWQAMRESIQGKRVLVSGGGGSIGSELCRQILRLEPKQLIVLDSCEYHLFCLQQELNSDTTAFSYLLADVTDRGAITRLFNEFAPQIVFHAAAYKHVPLLQPQIRAAVKNNVLGTYHIAQQAQKANVDKFVLVSTDKAVNPTNVMGASKRVAECVCQWLSAQSNNQTQFITVRFGNVLGSRGSVLETFKQQLQQGGPITVTHPDVTRYFMTIPEAAQLILQAQTLGEGGELFVLDMGEPIKIRYMAEQLIQLAGKAINKDIRIEYIGLRPGEKLFEELFHEQENLLSTKHCKIMKAKHIHLSFDILEQQLETLISACMSFDDNTMWQMMKCIVPELRVEVDTHFETV